MDASFFQSSDGLDQLEGEHGDDLGLDDAISMLVQADTEDLTGLVGEGRYGSFEDMADGSGEADVDDCDTNSGRIAAAAGGAAVKSSTPRCGCALLSMRPQYGGSPRCPTCNPFSYE